MQMLELIGYALSVIMGITLGLFGGGGSILTLPILVYFFQVNPVLGTAYSLFVVGSVAGVGSIRKLITKEVHLKVTAVFAIPSIAAVYTTRAILIPNIPAEIAQLGNFVLSKELALMLFFALIMLLASLSMIRTKHSMTTEHKPMRYGLILLDGLLVGTVTGLVGAGGGFLIVPALVLLVGMEMKQAVSTSLLIISLKSLIGFTGDLSSGQNIDWPFLLLFTGIAIIGMFIGLMLHKTINGHKLKRYFGVFVLIMALLILGIELFLKT